MIGVHVGRNEGGLPAEIKSARDAGCTAVQFFVMSPQQLRMLPGDDTEIRSALGSCHAWVHSSYLTSPWGRAPYNMPMCLAQIQRAVDVGASGTVFHLPNAPPEEVAKGLRRIVDRLPRGGHVVLENRAMRPNEHSYETTDQINALIEACFSAGVPRAEVQLCIDTAHLHATGTTLRTRAETEAWLRCLRYPGCIRLIHLNGNAGVGHRDIHTPAGGPHDRLWGGIPTASSGLVALRDFAQHNGTDMVIECNFDREREEVVPIIRMMSSRRGGGEHEFHCSY